jgi:RHS repeat-associated protein
MKNQTFTLVLAMICLAPHASQGRYLDTDTGRFTTMDTYDGDNEDPVSLHRYLYAADNPVNEIDPLGQSFIAFDGTGNYPGEMNDGVWAPSNIYKMWYGSTDPDRHYEIGVGTGAPILNLPGGAFGAGMAARERKAMRELLADRSAGDKTVDIIGFSRGGIEATEFANRVADAFGSDETIRFVGLFDPVGSVGHPGGFGHYRFQLPNSVEYSAEAMAANENRSWFPATWVNTTIHQWFPEHPF